MHKLKRWLALPLSAALALTLAAPVGAAGNAASFIIQAERADSVTRSLKVDLYRRDGNGKFQVTAPLRYESAVNRAAGDAAFTVRVAKDGARVTVDYLTDLNSDGVYELLDGESTPVSDALTAEGKLISTDYLGGAPKLFAGSYTISLAALTERGERTRGIRSDPSGTQGTSLTVKGKAPILYLVTLFGPEGKTEASNYLAIYDKVLMPADVPTGSWYYSAVEHAMDKGYIVGVTPDSFAPAAPVTRAQLAQILWNQGGLQEAKDPGYGDVSSSNWYYKAVAWCTQEGLMSGREGRFLPQGEVSREELALSLYKFAAWQGKDISMSQSLSEFGDKDSASAWAVEGLEWAVAAGVLSGSSDGLLHPVDSLTRAQLATVLRTFLGE